MAPLVGGTLLFFSILGVVVSPEVGASPDAAISVTLQSPASQPSGSAFTYSIELTCQLSAGVTCGPNTTVTIPLDGSTQPPMGTWSYAVSSTVPGLVSSATSAAGSPTSFTGTILSPSAQQLTPQSDPNGDGGRQLVVPLSDTVFVGGFNGAITLSVTPPNHATANGTAWAVTPTLTGGALGSITAAAPSAATATASLHPSLSASASQAAGSAGSVSYALTPTCDLNGALGDEWSTSGTLVDHLPAGATYQSATSGGVYDQSAGTVTWSFPSSTELPSGCAAAAGGATTDSVSVGFSSGTASAAVDQATFTLDGAGASTASASASPSLAGGPGAPPSGSAPAAPPSGVSPAAQAGLISISPAHQTHLTGTGQTYDINVSCLGEGDSECGPNGTITIPLDTTTTPPMTDPSWTYSGKSNPAGLLSSGPTIVGNNLVFELNDSVFRSGFSGSIFLVATPPNDVTPNHTSWSLSPTLTGGHIDPVTVPVPAASVATARPLLSLDKTVANGGSVFLAGADISYNLAANCDTAAPGGLFLTDGSLVDQLPPGMTFVSASDGGVFDSGTNTITWTFPDSASTPKGCAADAAGPNLFKVKVTAPTPAPPPADEPLVNKATFSGTGPDATNPAGISESTNAQAAVQIVNTPPTGPGSPGYATIAKTSLAPLAENVSGNQYVGTYPGNWVPTSSSPTYTVGAAAASFQARVHYNLVGTYETRVVDPLPCLDNANGNRYSSDAFNGAPCADPAFHPSVIEVTSAGFSSSNGLGAAIAGGFRPEAVLSDGTTVPLSPNGSVGPNASSAFFSIPPADIGLVATIVLPPNTDLMNGSLVLTMWGYTDASLAGLNDSINQLFNVATAVPMLNGTALTPIQDHASVFTVPTPIQLGISKSFGPTGGGPHGTTVLHIEGAVSLATVPLIHNIVLTDLLPLGMSWANPSASGSFTLVQGAGAMTKHVTGTAGHFDNYLGSGRELIRMTIPAAAFTSTGAWTITPPGNFLEMTTPPPSASTRTPTRSSSSAWRLRRATRTAAHRRSPAAGPARRPSNRPTPRTWTGTATTARTTAKTAPNSTYWELGAAFDLNKTVQGNLDPRRRGRSASETPHRADRGPTGSRGRTSGPTRWRSP